MATESSDKLETNSVDSMRAEIDTSAPFESVKEAANLFGRMGFWKPVSSHKPISDTASQHHGAMIDIVKVKEQAAQLERDLILKERETLDVLKELETTKNIVEELKLKLQKEAMEINAALDNNDVDFVAEIPEKGNHETGHQNGIAGLDLCPFEAPGFILLTRTRIKTAEIRLIAAKKMKEAARASEALGWTEIKALSNSETKCEDVITLTFEEYSSLISKAREAEQGCKNRVVDAMVRVDEANVSKTEILKKVEAATEEVKISKKALEEVLSRVEEANRGEHQVRIVYALDVVNSFPEELWNLTYLTDLRLDIFGEDMLDKDKVKILKERDSLDLTATKFSRDLSKTDPTPLGQATMCPDPSVAPRLGPRVLPRPGPRVRPRPGHGVPRPTRRSGDTRDYISFKDHFTNIRNMDVNMKYVGNKKALPDLSLILADML
ncbi:hypothetical protein BUALT_Bualt19G0023400 [Buddleja alternifolia]|uniref:Uncharacterized protein n=1 Tax=Buddleja alternifolia TaxID=168488 RepID=A0AAV6VZM7_9LAMI|nr:hypothetical protein BUALT_Bualt19G0023400 [Buddleja alternifolia]